MNLYKFYSKPDQLIGYADTDMKVPTAFWKKYQKRPVELKKREAAIASSAKYAYLYAKDILKGPFPLGEKTIVTDPAQAYWYAHDIIKGPFPLGEKAIASKAMYAYQYAKYVLKGPFLLGEPVIMSTPPYNAAYPIQMKILADRQ